MPSIQNDGFTHDHRLNTVIDADPTHNEAKMKLAELYEIMDEPRKALDLVYQGNQWCSSL
jgi:thioredoxin-like negative regulator of GroEL